MTAPKMSRQSLRSQEILLIEPNAMVGSIILSTARQLNLRPIKLATTCGSALVYLETQAFCGLITTLNEEAFALKMLTDLRRGSFKSSPQLPVAVTTTACGVDLATQMKQLEVKRVLLTPFKIRDLIGTIEGLLLPH
jgi:hypothetical protein